MGKLMDAFSETVVGDDGKRRLPVAGQRPSKLRKDVTIADVLRDPDAPAAVKDWLRKARSDPEWAVANNPPGFVSDEACWDKAKSAARHAQADDLYAFANYWYQEHCG